MAGDRRRWWMLGLGMGAQAASCVFLYGLPVMAQLIGLTGYAGAFGLGVLLPLAAIVAIPVRAEPPPDRAPEPTSTALAPRRSSTSPLEPS